LSVNPTIDELREVQAYFGLPSPALVDKDFYVVKALAAIAVVEREALHVRLVFGGGTALSRSYWAFDAGFGRYTECAASTIGGRRPSTHGT
jgi:hypothetical protein